MNQATIETSNQGVILVAGELNFLNAPQLRQQGKSLMRDKSDVVFDFEGVSHGNSAGLALLVSWARDAKRSGKSVVFKRLPKKLLMAARSSGLQNVLSI